MVVVVVGSEDTCKDDSVKDGGGGMKLVAVELKMEVVEWTCW
ncbi:hypothetical protein IFM89_037201 [Coptis chinensis]|uniref:Uncharacterized protein n=1 Tax=Coptis chinensis TaxID=261450 RepID=A0A835HF57_9MAGN|nr:hypothetical protein IFM89_037201 [Coptis chinensis]